MWKLRLHQIQKYTTSNNQEAGFGMKRFHAKWFQHKAAVKIMELVLNDLPTKVQRMKFFSVNKFAHLGDVAFPGRLWQTACLGDSIF